MNKTIDFKDYFARLEFWSENKENAFLNFKVMNLAHYTSPQDVWLVDESTPLILLGTVKFDGCITLNHMDRHICGAVGVEAFTTMLNIILIEGKKHFGDDWMDE